MVVSKTAHFQIFI